MLFCVLLLATAASAGGNSLSATISIQIDSGFKDLTIDARDSLSGLNNSAEVAKSFCEKHKVTNPRCPHFVAVELTEALWCKPGQKEAARAIGLFPPRTFRFIHHEHYFDSDEFSLLRPRLVSNGFVECTPGTSLSGTEDAVWLLGQLQRGNTEWFYAPLGNRERTPIEARRACVANTFPDAEHIGDKEKMFQNFVRLSKSIGDLAVSFLPRTWGPAQLAEEQKVASSTHKSDLLRGLWLYKDPLKELGSGITLVNDVSTSLMSRCEACVLQRYVDNPMLLNNKKFSIGVYTAVIGMEPLTVWLHREMLILVCTKDFVPGDSTEPLAHLTNGLLNRRLNPDQLPECAGCQYNATEQVWTTDRLLDYLEAHGISWAPIERQMRRIILTSFTSSSELFVSDLRKSVKNDDLRKELFSHWRFDFLLDATGGAWLLEAEIVPSAGTIGGVDEVIKTVVFRDLLSLVGWGPAQAENMNSSAQSEIDIALCEQQTPGGWSRKLCEERLIGRTVPSVHSPEDHTSWITGVLQRAGDNLAVDERSVALVADYEVRRRRRLGYETLIPVAADGGGRGYVHMDGVQGTTDPDLKKVETIYLNSKAMPSDLVLARWESAKVRSLDMDLQPDGDQRPWNESPESTPVQTRRQCESCLDSSNKQFCSSFSALSPDGHLTYRGTCTRSSVSCAGQPSGFVDGVAFTEKAQCAAFEPHGEEPRGNFTALFADLLMQSKAHLLGRFRPLVDELCQQQRRAHYDICSGFTSPKNTWRAPERISRNELCERGGLAALARRGLPVVIENSANLRGDGLFWSHDNMRAQFRDVEVSLLVYDGSRDSAQDVFTSNIRFDDFVKWTQDPSLFQVDGGLDVDYKNLILYLLLSNRDDFDEGVKHRGATNPNADVVNQNPLLRELLVNKTSSLFSTCGDVEPQVDFTEAWTSLRIGGAYTYPTHIDCFENTILQLHGNKTVHLMPPEMVSSVKPDPARKHWPSAAPQDLQRAWKANAWKAELLPGDELYVPLLWFHSVESKQSWSVTANRYYYKADADPISRENWGRHIASRKPAEWLKYESETGENLC